MGALTFALAWASVALAHPLGFAVLELRPEGDAIGWTLTVSPEEGRDADSLGVDFVGCEALEELPIRRGEGESIVRGGRVRCAGDARLVLTGASPDLDVLVRDQRSGALHRLSAAAPALDLATSSGIETLVGAGIEHAATGLDHLLFLLGLVLLVGASELRRVAIAVTAFTAGHLASMAGATLIGLSVDVPSVELLIALSLVALAAELARAWRGPKDTLGARHPAWYALGFGLLHGLGFASALAQTGLPLDHRLPALAGFHVGIELVQLGLVGAIVGAAALLGTRRRPLELVAAYVVGSVGAAMAILRL